MHAPTTTTTRAADTEAPIVPSRSEATRIWAAIGILATLVLVGGITASVIGVDYLAVGPGSAYETETLVAIDGAPTYAADGEVLFLTASVDTTNLSLLDAAQSWIDPDERVLPAEVIRSDRTPDEQRQQVQVQMQESKDIAVAVALTRLGITLSPTATGALISAVVPETPAESVLTVGDTVTAVDDQPITLHGQLAEAIRAHAPGDTVTLAIEDVNRSPRQATVTLGEHPEQAGIAFLGVESTSRDFDPGLPFAVTIDSGNVGGSSAGLAFTLAVIDLLTPGELTGGHRVAVTGTMRPDGTVGTIDAVTQKAVAARAAGADVLLVPIDNEGEARAHNHGMDVYAVATLDEALAVLQQLGGDPVP